MALAYGEFGRELGLRLEEARKKAGVSQERMWFLYAAEYGRGHKSSLTLRHNLSGKVAMDPVHYNAAARGLNPILVEKGLEPLQEAVLSFRPMNPGDGDLDLRVGLAPAV